MSDETEGRAQAALVHLGVPFTVTRHGPVKSLAEAAAARGIAPTDLIKTLVVRRAADEYLFVLLPGDREISWPKLRAQQQVNRLSLPDAATALAVTGYERGTITPFGATHPWPVIVDASVPGRTISIGGGAHGVGITLASDDLIRVLGAAVADISDPPSA